MVKKSTRASLPSQKAVTEQFERMAAMNGAAMGAFAEAFRVYANGWATLNTEMLSFITGRLEHDAEVGHKLAQCGNWSDAVELQQLWCRRTAEDYVTEATKLTEIASKLTSESWEPVYSGASRALDELQRPAA